jgi:ssDNA-binding replication factor A large subunit
MGNYERILERIAKASGLGREEIEKKIEVKRAKLSGLISKEGAAQVIAAELGINFESEKLRIDELLPGMRNVNITGKIIRLFPVRTFVRNGRELKVTNFILADETSNIRIVLWDVNHIGLLEKKEIGEGSVVEILNGNVRGNEIHLGSFSELKLSNEILEDVKEEPVFKEKKIVDFKISDNVKTRAFVVQAFEPRFFEVCPECKKKITLQGEGFFCQEHGKVVPEKRALINLVIDDGTENIRTVLFNEPLKGLGISVDNMEKFSEQKQELLGKEMLFSGNIRNNRFFNNLEFIVDSVQEIDVEELIGAMEK